MWKVRDLEKTKVKYRTYSPTSMTHAYMLIKERGALIRTVARQFGVPEASLRHILNGRVNPDAVRSGPPPLFTQEEKALFVQHLKFSASVGYGYSRAEVQDVASEYAVCLGKRDRDHPVSHQWYEHFMKRWPELKLVLARGLDIQGGKATSSESVGKYYSELDKILTKYSLRDKPERIFNIDEKGLSTSHKPPRVVRSPKQ